jgi:hypothetical protein
MTAVARAPLIAGLESLYGTAGRRFAKSQGFANASGRPSVSHDVGGDRHQDQACPATSPNFTLVKVTPGDSPPTSGAPARACSSVSKTTSDVP